MLQVCFKGGFLLGLCGGFLDERENLVPVDGVAPRCECNQVIAPDKFYGFLDPLSQAVVAFCIAKHGTNHPYFPPC